MTEILMQSPSHHNLPCSPSSIPTDYYNDGLLHQTGHHNHPEYNSTTLFNSPHSYPVAVCSGENTVLVDDLQECTVERKRRERDQAEAVGDHQVSLLAVFVTVFRKSLVACRSAESFEQEMSSMEIGLPTNVRHVAHVTFDRFNGFLGLPVEFEPEVPRRPPSASTSVFGVSTEAMQLSFDSRGNSVPTVLLMMQRRLYSQGGLQAEGIFRINGENGQEEHMREKLNRGEVPENIDVHCLAGLIKAWFRELPNGVLDSLEPEQVMQAQSEDECSRLVRLLPPTEASLMDWALNLMADVAQLEHFNKMNARNVAMVFAPNMTQMADPLTALMYAVQVMNFLKTLIVKTLREREEYSIVDPASHSEPSDESGHQGGSSHQITKGEAHERIEDDQVFAGKEPLLESPTHHPYRDDLKMETHGLLSSIENFVKAHEAGKRHLVDNCPHELPNKFDSLRHGLEDANVADEMNGGTHEVNSRKARSSPSSNSYSKKNPRKVGEMAMAREAAGVEKSRGSTIVSRLNSRIERVEAWR